MSIPVKPVDIVTLLREYNKNLENQRLKALYNSVTVFDIIGKGRNETAHSSFLNWLLTANEVQGNSAENPLIGLLDCLVRRIYKQYRIDSFQQSDSVPYADIEPISNALLSRTLKISNIEGQTEVPVTSIVTSSKINEEIENWYAAKKKKGRGDSIDIRITCDVGGIDCITKFEFIIENKIGSKEGGIKDNNNVGSISYSSLTQTERYYYACNNGNQDGIYQFFIYLSPASEEELEDHADEKKRLCTSNNFICINYQDLYDDIISPLLESQRLPQREEYLIQEYVRVLSIPLVYKLGDNSDDDKSSSDAINTSIILATSKAERDLLIKYWNNNHILIIAALQAYEKNEVVKEHKKIVCVDDEYHFYTKEDVIQKYYELYKEQHQSDAVTSFNQELKGIIKKRGFSGVIDEETENIKPNIKPDLVDECYSAVCNGNLFNDITYSIAQLSFADTYDEVLRNFWEVNKFLIMSSTRVMANNNLHKALEIAITESYKGLSRSDNTSYYASREGVNHIHINNAKSLAIYRWFAQTLIWEGSQCRPNIKEANKKFREAIGYKKDSREFLTTDQNKERLSQWIRLSKPNWCQQGGEQSNYYLDITNYRSSFQKLLEHLKDSTNGYSIREI